MTIVLERYTIPERGVFEIDLKQSIEIRVTAEEARRKVNRWLLDYVSYMMHAEAPTLVIGEQQVAWRVPAIFTSSQVGNVGIVGYVDVDIYNGQMNNTAERKEHISQCAKKLAEKLPPYQPIQSVPEAFIPKHLPRAKIAQLPEDDE